MSQLSYIIILQYHFEFMQKIIALNQYEMIGLCLSDATMPFSFLSIQALVGKWFSKNVQVFWVFSGSYFFSESASVQFQTEFMELQSAQSQSRESQQQQQLWL